MKAKRLLPLWFAAPELTLARPKAPHIAGRALSAPTVGQIHLPTRIAMRTMRQKSSRFCALKYARTSSVNLVGITTGSSAPDIEFLAANSPLIERAAISLAFSVG
jgi:hypothetical protein